MVSKRFSKAFCSGDFTKIENYEKAIADKKNIWHIHHRLETHFPNGERLFIDYSLDFLKSIGMYYKRPPEELIYLTLKEHSSLHNKGKLRRRGINSPNYGKHLPEETRRKMAKSHKGLFEGEKNPMYGKHGENNPMSIKVLCVETGVIYNSLREAADDNNLSMGNLCSTLKGLHHTTGGFHWEYVK